MLDHPGGAYALEWAAPTAAGTRLIRFTPLEGGLEVVQAIIDEEG